MNEAGLAFDWVAGFEEKHEGDLRLKPARGNPSERMLESCSTLDEAIAFYRTYLEPDFKRSRMMVADRSGASAVIGGAQRQVARRKASSFTRLQLGARPAHGGTHEIVRADPGKLRGHPAACVQPDGGGTKYSNVFDLKTGVVLFTDPRRDESVTLTLAAELGKGAHYYDISRLREQLSVPPRPLPDNMKRFYLAGPHSYRYLFDFAKARVLGRYVITSNNIVTLFQSEAVARKP